MTKNRNSTSSNNNNIVVKKVPPDGGWGWVIVFAYALANMCLIPTITNFGLLYRDKLKMLNMPATDVSLIININSAFSMSLGLINGPLLNKYGYRRIGAISGVLFSIGVMLTAFSNSLMSLLISYGIIVGAGFGLSLSAFSLAFNSYFRKNRNKASGISMTLTGLGPVLYPHCARWLLDNYGTFGSILIMGAVQLHIILAALLLQPIKWHMKNEIIERRHSTAVEVPLIQKENNASFPSITGSIVNKRLAKIRSISYTEDEDENVYGSHRSIYDSDVDIDNQNIYGAEQVVIMRRPSQLSMYVAPIPISSTDLELGNRQEENTNAGMTRNMSTILNRIPETEALSIDEQPNDYIAPPSANKSLRWYQSGSIENIKTTDSKQQEDSEMVKQLTVAERIVKFFDLTLLRDKIYVNIMLGLSWAIFAELNFAVLTPFILMDMNYSAMEIATLMSAIAISDLLCRFVTPFVGDYFHGTSRIMYMISLLMLVLTRFGIIMVQSFEQMMTACICLGIARGIRTVYWSLVIPDYVPIERLASAAGLQMTVNALFLISLGPVVGFIRDLTGSYSYCIIFLNFMTSITLVMWTTEMVFLHFKPKNVTTAK